MKKTCGLAVLYEEDNMNKQIPNLACTLFLLLELYIHFIVPGTRHQRYQGTTYVDFMKLKNVILPTYAPLITVMMLHVLLPRAKVNLIFLQIDNIV